MNLVQRLTLSFAKQVFKNKFNQAFLHSWGGGHTTYDANGLTYINKGYKLNPDVYSMINKMSTKTASIPKMVKKIEDKSSLKQLQYLKKATGSSYSSQQLVKKFFLEQKAFSDEIKPWPLERPNVNQTWREWDSLWKTFLRMTGNVYIFDLMPSEGVNAGRPIATYLLPSHLIKIVVKDEANMLEENSDPIKEYLLIHGEHYVSFKPEEVIHVKYANPDYDMSGAHLYGQSPLMACLRNINSSNSAIDNNIKTLQNSGAFGFFHSKGQKALTEAQAKELKERLKEMDQDPSRLANIAGVSSEIGFTRISLTTDELKPFEYSQFDKEKIADSLDWEIIDSTRGDYGGTIKEIRKQRITDNIVPDLDLMFEALNTKWLPKFKEYQGYVLEYDIMELPEMQDDMEKLMNWIKPGIDSGIFIRDEVRPMFNFPKTELPEMEVATVQQDLWTLKEAVESDFNSDGDI